MQVILQADQGSKQNHKDTILSGPSTRTVLIEKVGLIFSRNTIECRLQSFKKLTALLRLGHLSRDHGVIEFLENTGISSEPSQH